MTSFNAITLTQKWIKEIVIGQNFCPFAAQPFFDQKIRYVESAGEDLKSLLETFILELKYLDHHPEIETSFIIYTSGLLDFGKYLDVLHFVNQLLKKESYAGIYQVASFHPKYRFQGSNEHTPSNYTNRSPFPMFHLLRESSLDIAVSKHKDVHAIPPDNIDRADKLGLSFFVEWHKTNSNEIK